MGWVTLLSNKDENEVQINAKRLQDAARSQGKDVVKRKIFQIGLRFVKVNGDCCWEVGERYLGGATEQLWVAHTYYLPWSVRSIQIIDC